MAVGDRVTIAVESPPDPETALDIHAGLHQHHLSRLGDPHFALFAVTARDEDGRLVGGLIANTFYGRLYIDVMWVAEERRRQGLGRRLMARGEEYRVDAGCAIAHLEAGDARDFYARLGYRVFAELEGVPPAAKRYYMQKRLRPS